MKRFCLLLAAALTIGLVADAVPAKRGFRTIAQPDGTVVRAELVGDEFMHFYRTEDGTPLMRDAEGYMRLATTDANGRLAIGRRVTAADLNATLSPAALDATYKALSEQAAENAYPQQGKGLFTSNYPRTGEVHCLVFLVEYNDVAFQLENPQEYFNNMLNQEGFDEYGGTGSARDYFLYQSKGQFQPTFDVYGPVQLAHNRKYYGGNDWWGNDQNPQAMVIEACEAFAEEIDFSEYDYDNDGCVDNIYVFYAGQGEATYGSDDTVWPHSWTIPDGPTHNGKLISSYTCSNEWELGRPDGIGTFCHEFSHTMGLPDLYSTTYNQFQTYTPGAWSVLDYGPYNNDGRTPPNYSAYERNAMGWLNALVVDGPESILLDPVDISNEAVVIGTSKENEFFLFENRQKNNWDAYVPGHGMLVWHIDFNQAIFDSNTVNNQAHQYVDIVEANGRSNNNSQTIMAGYTFPGTSEKTSFTAETSPAFSTWSGEAIELPITEITETEDGLITFNVAGGATELDIPEGLTAQANDKGEIILSWQPVLGASFYFLSVYTRDEASNEPQYFSDYNAKRIRRDNKYVVSGVNGPRTFYVALKAANSLYETENCEEVAVEVPKINFIYTAPTATAASGIFCDAFTANWLQHPDAVKYYLTVEGTAIYGEYPDEVIDFGSGNALYLPEGWDWSGSHTSLYYSSASGYFGASAPSLKFQQSENVLTSPVFEVPVAKITYWVRGASATDESSFNLEARRTADGEYEVIHSISPLSEFNNSEGNNVEIEFESALYRQFRFAYNKGSRGNAALDDILIIFPAESYLPVEGYEASDRGTDLSAFINMLPEGITALRYYVEAEDATGARSARSNYVEVMLEGESGISAPEAAAALKVIGRTVVYTGNSGDSVSICDLAGRTIARAIAAADGKATLELPAGFYIVSTPAGASKVALQ